MFAGVYATVLAGCQSYEPMPASHQALSQALLPPDTADLAQQASAFHHPLLRPVLIGPDGSLTPQAAAVVAVLRSPSLRAARARRGLAAAQLIEAGILPNPQLSANLDFPIAGETDGTVNAFGLGATWDVTSLIGREEARSAASHESTAIDLEIAWQEWQAAMGAKLHASRVLWLSLQRDELARQVAQAVEAEARIAQNAADRLATVIETEAAGALVQKRRAALLAIEANIVSESGLLRQALGLPQQAQVHIVADSGETVVSDPLPDEVELSIEHNRLDLAALRAGYASQEAKLHAAVLSQFPKIGMGITRARDTGNVGTLGFGITLDLPIFDQGQGRIAIERANRQILFDELVARTFDARSDAARALAELAAIRPQLTQARRTADRLRSLATRLEVAQRQGDTDVVQLAQARNDAADAEVEAIRFRQQEAELQIALEVAMGGFTGDRQP